MVLETIYIIVLLATGLAVGFAVGLLGVGGCFIMIPVMAMLFIDIGVPVDTAVKLAFGTNMLVVLPTAISGSLAHHQKKSVLWKAAIVFGTTGAAGSLLGSTITSQLIGGGVAKMTFGAATVLAAIRMLTAKLPGVEEKLKDKPRLWAGCGFPLGVAFGLIGIGGGILSVPVMTTAFKFKMHRAVGTSAGLMMFTSAAGAFGYFLNGLHASNLPPYSIGYLNLPVWFCLAATSVGMAQVSARIAHRLAAQMLRIIFIIVMLYMGFKMIGMLDWLGLPP